jgi:hypothetical protein
MHYQSANEEDEVIIQAAGDKLSIRVSEDDHNTAMVYLPVEEIDRMIAGLQSAKAKIATSQYDMSWDDNWSDEEEDAYSAGEYDPVPADEGECT